MSKRPGISERERCEISTPSIFAFVWCGSRSPSRLTDCNGASLSNTASAGDHRLSARRLGRHHRASDESMAHRAARPIIRLKNRLRDIQTIVLTACMMRPRSLSTSDQARYSGGDVFSFALSGGRASAAGQPVIGTKRMQMSALGGKADSRVVNFIQISIVHERTLSQTEPSAQSGRPFNQTF